MTSVVLYFMGTVVFIGSYNLIQCYRLQAIPSVPTIRHYNTTYLEDVIIKTRRRGRRSEYAFNMEFTSKHLWTDHNVSIHFIFYEYLHNEYKPSFVELHFKICDLILRDMIVGPVVRKAGVTVCPLPPGRYHLMNMTYNQEFPNIFPFEKGKLELIVKLEPGGKEFARGDLIMTFKLTKT